MKMFTFVKSIKGNNTFKVKSLNGKLLYTGSKKEMMAATQGTDIEIRYCSVKGNTYTMTADFSTK